MPGREVTERDFRCPEFRDAKVEDYEFRADGKLVRKDRWESAIHEIRHLVGPHGREFEIPDVVAAVRKLTATFDGWTDIEEGSTDPDDWPVEGSPVDLRLEDESILRNACFSRTAPSWSWHGCTPPLPVVAWRPHTPDTLEF